MVLKYFNFSKLFNISYIKEKKLPKKIQIFVSTLSEVFNERKNGTVIKITRCLRSWPKGLELGPIIHPISEL